MTGWVDTLHLKEKAEEDVWFARRDRELKAALKRRRAEGDGQGGDKEPESRDRRPAR